MEMNRARLQRKDVPKKGKGSKPGARGANKRQRRGTADIKELVVKVRKLMAEGKTQSEAADELEVPQGNVSKWLREDAKGKLDNPAYANKKTRDSQFLKNFLGDEYLAVEKKELEQSKKKRSKKWPVRQSTLKKLGRKAKKEGFTSGKWRLTFSRTWIRGLAARNLFGPTQTGVVQDLSKK